MHKVDRAKEHLDALRKLIEDWQKLHLQSITTKDDPEAGEYIVELKPPELNLIRTALIAGDFVCCLRSALDHLVWQIYFINHPDTKDPVPKRLCFPIYDVATLDNEIAFAKSTFGLPQETVALIKHFQPYQHGDASKVHFLWILNVLWTIDKHRHIPLKAQISEYNFGSNVHPIRTETFDDHAKIYFRLADKSKVEFNPFQAEVVFGDKQDGISVSLRHLTEIYEAVRNKIIPAFSRFLP